MNRQFKTFGLLSIIMGISSAACSNGQPNMLIKREVQNVQKELSTSSNSEAAVNASAAQSTSEAASTKPEGAETASSAIEFKLNANAEEKSVDAEALTAARNAGHSDQAILNAAALQNLPLREDALKMVGLSKYILKQYGTNSVNGVTAMGLAAVDKARAAGVKDNEIIIYARLQGISFGELALNSLGLGKLVLRQYGGSPVEEFTAIGLAAVDKARAAGVKDADIIKYAKLQNIVFGEQALSSLGLGKFLLKQYGGQDSEGIWAIGLAGVDRARAAGISDAEIIIYAKLQSVYFGEKALQSLGV